MFIQRDYSRTEKDDYTLNVEPKIGEYKESVEVIVDGVIVGWKIQNQYD
jgi:hypothetical protein